MIKMSKKTGDRHKLYVMFFAETVYHLWLQRNENEKEAVGIQRLF